jgi:hypothetical protein
MEVSNVAKNSSSISNVHYLDEIKTDAVPYENIPGGFDDFDEPEDRYLMTGDDEELYEIGRPSSEIPRDRRAPSP